MSIVPYISLSSAPEQTKTPITLSERVVINSNSLLWGISTSSLLVEALWYGGMVGLELTGVAAVGAITGVGVGMAILTLPIAYSFRKQMLAEITAANAAIIEAEELRQKKFNNLFFALLRLRSFYGTKEKFSEHVKFEPSKRINQDDLVALVDETYLYLKEKRTAVPELLRDTNRTMKPETHAKIMDIVKTQSNFASNIVRCFDPFPFPPVKNKHKAAGWGVISGLTAGGVTLGTGWAFGALLIGSGLCAAIPVIGWGILGIASLVTVAIIGLGVGFCKHKNYQRKALAQSIQKNNAMLEVEIQNINQKNFENSAQRQELEIQGLSQQLARECEQNLDLLRKLNLQKSVTKNSKKSVPTQVECSALRKFSIVSSRHPVSKNQIISPVAAAFRV